MLELGPIEQNIAKQAVRAGEQIPERIKDAPMVAFGSMFYLQAFFDLDTERMNGFGVGRIPWTSIVKYGEFHNLTHTEIDDLIKIIRALDKVNLEWLSKRA